MEVYTESVILSSRIILNKHNRLKYHAEWLPYERSDSIVHFRILRWSRRGATAIRRRDRRQHSGCKRTEELWLGRYLFLLANGPVLRFATHCSPQQDPIFEVKGTSLT